MNIGCDSYRELYQALSNSCAISINTDKKIKEVTTKIGKEKEGSRFTSIVLNKANEVKKFHEDTKKAIVIEILRFCGVNNKMHTLLELDDVEWLFKFMPERGDKTETEIQHLKGQFRCFDNIEKKVMNTLLGLIINNH